MPTGYDDNGDGDNDAFDCRFHHRCLTPLSVSAGEAARVLDHTYMVALIGIEASVINQH